MRERELSADSDAYLRERLLSSNPDVDLDAEPWASAYFIVPYKRLGFEINAFCALKRSRKMKRRLHVIAALDSVND